LNRNRLYKGHCVLTGQTKPLIQRKKEGECYGSGNKGEGDKNSRGV